MRARREHVGNLQAQEHARQGDARVISVVTTNAGIAIERIALPFVLH
jgi:hypothetical protein